MLDTDCPGLSNQLAWFRLVELVRNRSTSVPGLRIRDLNQKPIPSDGKYILYWMTSAPRPYFNFAIDRSVEISIKPDRPLVVLETVFVDYPWASHGIHQFIIDGIADNTNAFSKTDAFSYPYIERRPGKCTKLLDLLSKDARIILTDDYPDRYLQRSIAAIAKMAQFWVEAIDSNRLFPMRATQKVFSGAYDFRRFLKHKLPWHLAISQVKMRSAKCCRQSSNCRRSVQATFHHILASNLRIQSKSSVAHQSTIKQP